MRDLLAQRAYRTLRERCGRPAGGRGAVRAAVRGLEGGRAAARVQGALRRRELPVRRHGRRPRAAADEGGASLARPPLFALRDVAFYASIAAVAFMAGRRSGR